MRTGVEATAELVRRTAGAELRPGLVVSLATAGDLLQWHPHLHLLTTDGSFASGDRLLPLPEWDAALLTSLFRERLLARLLDRHAISHELARKLLAWRRPGFSAHVGEPIGRQHKQRLEDTLPTSCETPCP